MAVLAVVTLAVSALVLSRRPSTAGASLASAPEYLPAAGKPVVQRVLAIDGRDLRVHLRVTAVPVGGLTITERIPPLVQQQRVTVGGRVTTLTRTVPCDSTFPTAPRRSRRSRTASRSAPTAPSAFLRRYAARVRFLRTVPTPDRPDTLALEVAPAVRLKAHQRAWLPVSGRSLAGATDTTVAESLGRTWAWTSSDPHVATVVHAHPHAAAAGRVPDTNAFRIDATAPGSTVVATVVAGVRYAVTITVTGHAQRAVVCDPGVFPGSRLQLATNGQSTHPVEGTLVAVGAAGTPASRAVGGRLVPLSRNDVPCDEHVRGAPDARRLRPARRRSAH